RRGRARATTARSLVGLLRWWAGHARARGHRGISAGSRLVVAAPTRRGALDRSAHRLLARVAHDGEPLPSLFPAHAPPGGFLARRQRTDALPAPPHSAIAPTVAANASRVAPVRLAMPVPPRYSTLMMPVRGPA